MDLIRWSMNKPVSVSVGVLLVCLFGLIGLRAIPLQLTPTVDRPIITVTTNWPGRSPQEVVDEVTKEQERRLKNTTGLKNMRSTSREGGAEIELEFYIGTDVTRALQEVSDALRQVPDYPDEVDEPTIKAAEGAAENAIAWIIIDLDPEWAKANPGFDISTLYTAFDREIKPFIERIDGVAEVNIYGGREREVHVLADPVLLAQRGLSYADVVNALSRENRDISAGTISEGKRDYRVRVTGQFETEADVLGTIVAYRDGFPVFVKDVATVEFSHQKRRGFVRSMGRPCLAMNVIRQSGANVVDVMADLRLRLEEARTEILPLLDPAAGPHLRMEQVYDETTYIDSAIDLVVSNLWVAAVLAAITLFAFLRSVRSTFIIVLSLPVSIIGTFLVMLAMGRTLNVISLAGLAFATGVVVDNANVVLENIDRRRTMGDPPLTAIYRGTREVWGAILASTLTTVCVFIPLLTIQEEAGQLFFDLTLAMAASVTLSLIVAVTVVPCATALLEGKESFAKKPSGLRGMIVGLFGFAALCGRLTRGTGDLVRWLITGWRAHTLRPVIIAVLFLGSLVGSWWLMPPIDYLPKGNRNLVFGGLLVPPGLSVDQMERYAERIESTIQPYIDADLNDPSSLAALAPIPRFDKPGTVFDPVPVDRAFIGAFNGGMFVGGTSQDPQRVIPIGNLFTTAMNSIPDSFGGAGQTSLFGRGVAGGSAISVEISGPDLARVTQAATAVFMQSAGKYGFGNVRPTPSNYNLAQQELRVRLNDAGRRLGLRTEDVGLAARGLFDGAFAGDFILEGRTIDLMVLPKGGRLEIKERLADIPVMTPAGRVVPLASVVDLIPTTSPQEILRIEELPGVSVDITPPQDVSVQEVMDVLNAEVLAPLRQGGLIDRTMRVSLEGTAAQLDEVRGSLFGIGVTSGSSGLRRAGLLAAGVAGVLGLLAAAYAAARAVRPGPDRKMFVYAALAFLVFAGIIAGLFAGVGTHPEILLARFVWALLVTYLLMAALFESWLYPFVIMFSVPAGLLGGFGALRLVHDWTLTNPAIAPQQLDVLTMIGFVVLVGTVVNNAILLVEQTLNFMNPGKAGAESAGDEPLGPVDAIAQSVRTRIRPVMMTSMTTVAGGLPLILSPGEGSEMYRGFGAVVVGGLLVSTFFTLVLVPLVLSVAFDMKAGVARLRAPRAASITPPAPAGA